MFIVMFQSMVKEDPLSRIQREIIEVTEREREFKEGHFRINRLMSESTLEVARGERTERTLGRAVSTSQLLAGTVAPSTPSPLNGYSRRFAPQSGTRGIMQRFIASRGKLSPAQPSAPLPAASPPVSFVPVSPPSPPVVVRGPDGRPARKGFVPVEEKIQRELREMQDREHELKRQRRRPRSELDLDLSDDSELSEDDERPVLKPAKSIGELYEAPDSLDSSGGGGGMKPARSLAELCALPPGQELETASSTRLIAHWESRIQQTQEAGAAY